MIDGVEIIGISKEWLANMVCLVGLGGFISWLGIVIYASDKIWKNQIKQLNWAISMFIMGIVVLFISIIQIMNPEYYVLIHESVDINDVLEVVEIEGVEYGSDGTQYHLITFKEKPFPSVSIK